MDAPPKSRRRRRALALLVSLALSAAAGELFARLRFGVPLVEHLPLMTVRASASRGWEMVPGLAHYTYHHRVEVDSLGLRGRELAPKAAGERRILFLGDSLTYGQGVGDDETVPAALEQALSAHDPGRVWRVANGGNRAYGTGQEIALLEELGERIEPDVVLLGWYWNDVDERPIQRTYEAFLPRGEFAFDTGGKLEGFARFQWHAEQLPRRSALVMWLHDLASAKGDLFPPEVVDQGLQRLGRHLVRFRELCARLSAEPVMVIYPDPNRLRGAHATRACDERAAALARQHALPVIELLPALEPLHAASGSLPILPYDGHYDAHANRAMGAYLAERLLALGLVKHQQ